jgi:hypothetical protein
VSQFVGGYHDGEGPPATGSVKPLPRPKPAPSGAPASPAARAYLLRRLDNAIAAPAPNADLLRACRAMLAAEAPAPGREGSEA